MKFKICSVILLLISICLIFSGYSVQFLDGFNKDKEETMEIDERIDKSYKLINQEMISIHLSMSEMQTFFELYYEEVSLKQSEYQEKLKSITIKKEYIDNEVKVLENDCKKTVNTKSKDKCQITKNNISTLDSSYQELNKTYEDFINSHEQWFVLNNEA